MNEQLLRQMADAEDQVNGGVAAGAMTVSFCPHAFKFLRQEEKNIGYDRSPTYLIQDVYFCEKCLKYQRVDVRRETPRNDSFTGRYVEHLV